MALPVPFAIRPPDERNDWRRWLFLAIYPKMVEFGSNFEVIHESILRQLDPNLKLTLPTSSSWGWVFIWWTINGNNSCSKQFTQKKRLLTNFWPFLGFRRQPGVNLNTQFSQKITPWSLSSSQVPKWGGGEWDVIIFTSFWPKKAWFWPILSHILGSQRALVSTIVLNFFLNFTTQVPNTEGPQKSR